MSQLQLDGWQLKETGWCHPSAMIVGSDVGQEKDEIEYKSLMVPDNSASQKPPPMKSCQNAKEVIKKVEDHSKEITPC